MIQRIANDSGPLGDVRAVENELMALWRQVGQLEEPMVRARVMTLVVVAEASREAELVETMMELSGRHPSRQILLLLGEGEKDTLEAMATLLCHPSGHRLCAEQIRVEASGAAIERLPSAVRALLVADLPAILWWTLSPTDERVALCEALAEEADYLFFDSALLCEAAPLAALDRRWSAMTRRDLAWSRLTPWRELVARQFDAPANRPLLDQIETLEIKTGRCPLHGWLMLGWIATSLRWKARDAEGAEVRFDRADGDEVVATLVAESGEERLRSITLGGAGFSIALSRAKSGRGRCQTERDGATRRDSFHIERERDLVTLSRELDAMHHGRAYADALAVIRRALSR